MPQISLYVEKDFLGKIESAARREKVSVSKWVRKKLEKEVLPTWPDGYFDLFGSIKDPDFKVHPLPFSKDSKRATL